MRITKGMCFMDVKGGANIVIAVDHYVVTFSVICSDPYIRKIEKEGIKEMLEMELLEFDEYPFKVDRTSLLIHLEAFQFLYIPVELSPLPDKNSFTVSTEDYRNFRGYAIPLIKKVMKCNRTKAEKAFDEFYDKFGIKLKQ